ncbi:UNVERIFIED_CONTAM: hypothetical protein FKN15_069564 [Acipenser sinensis]
MLQDYLLPSLCMQKTQTAVLLIMHNTRIQQFLLGIINGDFAAIFSGEVAVQSPFFHRLLQCKPVSAALTCAAGSAP